MNLNFIRNFTSHGHIWPDIDYELEEYRPILKGKILNAGTGTRDISHLVSGELINQDIKWEDDKRSYIHIFSPLDKIPVDDNHFDVIICIAVLEHVENPEEVVPELFRVLKPGGHLILSVPFLQPEHKIPTDYQRYTKDGLIRIVEHNGFKVLNIKPIFTVYHTLYWIVREWLHLKNSLLYKFLRLILLVPLGVAAKRSSLTSEKIASAFQLLATK